MSMVIHCHEEENMDLKYAFWNNKGGTGKTSTAIPK